MSRYDPNWVWDEARQNYYRAELKNGVWTSVWAPKSSVPSAATYTPSQGSTAGPGFTQNAPAPASYQTAGPYASRHGAPQYADAAPNSAASQLSAGFSQMAVTETPASTYPCSNNQIRGTANDPPSRQGPVYRRPSSTSAGGNPYSQNPAQSGSRSITSQAVPNAASAGGSVYSQSPRHGAHHSVPLRKVSTFANDGNNRISQVQPSAVSGVRGGKQISLGAEAGKTNYINTATQIDEQEMQSIYADNKLRMRGSEGPFEHLDPSFQVIKNQDEWTFFANGRVFSMLMWQAGGNAGGGPSVMRFGQEAFAKIYRFIVVQPRCKQHYSKCIRISTHGGQGVTKKGLNQKEHCIVYTGRVAPKPLPGESKMKKDPIEMEPVNSSEKLDLLSRVDLAKTYPVEHNVRVKEVGMVSKVHLKRLLAYVRDCQ